MRARGILRKVIVGPVVIEPLPVVHGYRWRGQLNGGAVLEGVEKYLGCRGRESNPHTAGRVGSSSHGYVDRPEVTDAIV